MFLQMMEDIATESSQSTQPEPELETGPSPPIKRPRNPAKSAPLRSKALGGIKLVPPDNDMIAQRTRLRQTLMERNKSRSTATDPALEIEGGKVRTGRTRLECADCGFEISLGHFIKHCCVRASPFAQIDQVTRENVLAVKKANLEAHSGTPTFRTLELDCGPIIDLTGSPLTSASPQMGSKEGVKVEQRGARVIELDDEMDEVVAIDISLPENVKQHVYLIDVNVGSKPAPKQTVPPSQELIDERANIFSAVVQHQLQCPKCKCRCANLLGADVHRAQCGAVKRAEYIVCVYCGIPRHFRTYIKHRCVTNLPSYLAPPLSDGEYSAQDDSPGFPTYPTEYFTVPVGSTTRICKCADCTSNRTYDPNATDSEESSSPEIS